MYIKNISKNVKYLIFTLLFVPSVCLSEDVTLTWDPNTESDLAGYRMFLRETGEAYDYSYPEWEGTQNSCTISGLDEYESYYFVVRAFNTAGLESGNSNEAYLSSNDLSPEGLPGSDSSGSSDDSGCFIGLLIK